MRREAPMRREWGAPLTLPAAPELARALAFRAKQAWPTDVVRLVDDAADDCPGVVVERFGPVVRIELRPDDDMDAVAAQRFYDVVLPHVRGLAGVTAATGLVRKKSGQHLHTTLWGEVPTEHVVHEHGLSYAVRMLDKDAAGVGLFVDHRIGRQWVHAHARGQRVLNLFAHAGGFGVAAATGGAVVVDHVDAARKCALWAAHNLTLNGVDAARHRFLVEDALYVLSRAARRAQANAEHAYGIIVCDPPTTARRKDGSRFHVEKDLMTLASDALLALKPGGYLLLSTNNRALSVEDVMGHARAAAVALGVVVATLKEVPLPDDVASKDHPHLRPMRGVWLERG